MEDVLKCKTYVDPALEARNFYCYFVRNGHAPAMAAGAAAAARRARQDSYTNGGAHAAMTTGAPDAAEAQDDDRKDTAAKKEAKRQRGTPHEDAREDEDDDHVGGPSLLSPDMGGAGRWTQSMRHLLQRGQDLLTAFFRSPSTDALLNSYVHSTGAHPQVRLSLSGVVVELRFIAHVSFMPATAATGWRPLRESDLVRRTPPPPQLCPEDLVSAHDEHTIIMMDLVAEEGRKREARAAIKKKKKDSRLRSRHSGTCGGMCCMTSGDLPAVPPSPQRALANRPPTRADRSLAGAPPRAYAALSGRITNSALAANDAQDNTNAQPPREDMLAACQTLAAQQAQRFGVLTGETIVEEGEAGAQASGAFPSRPSVLPFFSICEVLPPHKPTQKGRETAKEEEDDDEAHERTFSLDAMARGAQHLATQTDQLLKGLSADAHATGPHGDGGGAEALDVTEVQEWCADAWHTPETTTTTYANPLLPREDQKEQERENAKTKKASTDKKASLNNGEDDAGLGFLLRFSRRLHGTVAAVALPPPVGRRSPPDHLGGSHPQTSPPAPHTPSRVSFAVDPQLYIHLSVPSAAPAAGEGDRSGHSNNKSNSSAGIAAWRPAVRTLMQRLVLMSPASTTLSLHDSESEGAPSPPQERKGKGEKEKEEEEADERERLHTLKRLLLQTVLQMSSA